MKSNNAVSMPGAFERVPVALGLLLMFLCLENVSQPITQMIVSFKPEQKPGKSFSPSHQELVQSFFWGGGGFKTHRSMLIEII